jgi:hypothetical protein
VHVNFSRWAIPDSALQDLWEIVEKSPINPRTNRHFLMLTVLNAGMIHFGLNMLCSMQLAGIAPNHHFMICLDEESFAAVTGIGAQAVYLPSNFTNIAVNNRHIVDFYDIVKVKPTFCHQLLLWNVEVNPVDADIVFLENPLDLYDDSADLETQCDSKVYFQIPYGQEPVPWEVNLGYYRLHPTPFVMKLMPIWLSKMFVAPKLQDQSVLRRLLKPYPTRWLNKDTVIVSTDDLFPGDPDAANFTVRFLDPMLLTNAGGLWQEGKANWTAEARRRGIRRPKLIHFFHMGFIREKVTLIRDEGLEFVTSSNQCIKEQTKAAKHWPLWNNK